MTASCKTSHVPEQRRPTPAEQARTRSAQRRDRARDNLVTGANGKPYAMRRRPDGELVDDLPHGDVSTYGNRLCRCDRCSSVHAAAGAADRAAVRAAAAARDTRGRS